MQKKDSVYLSIIFFLIVITVLFGWGLNKCYVTRHTELEVKNLEIQLQDNLKDNLIKDKLATQGYYLDPVTLVIGDRGGVSKLYLKNNFQTAKRFDVEIAPNLSITPSPSYDAVSISKPQSDVLLPRSEKWLPIYIKVKNTPLSYNLDSPSYTVKIKSDGEDYAQVQFLVVVFPQNEIDKENNKNIFWELIIKG